MKRAILDLYYEGQPVIVTGGIYIWQGMICLTGYKERYKMRVFPRCIHVRAALLFAPRAQVKKQKGAVRVTRHPGRKQLSFTLHFFHFVKNTTATIARIIRIQPHHGIEFHLPSQQPPRAPGKCFNRCPRIALPTMVYRSPACMVCNRK